MRTPSIDVLLPQKNAFHATMLNLEADPKLPLDSFSAACLEVFAHRDPDALDYRLAQVFEQAVLDEVAYLEGLDPRGVASLTHATSVTMRALRSEIEADEPRTCVRSMNLATVLISVSRFALAEQLLDDAQRSVSSDAEWFELSLLRFIVGNRIAAGAGSAQQFSAMRAAARSGEVPPVRLLDACTQAVVWYLKRRELCEDDLTWFVRTGLAIVQDHRFSLPAGAISAWYRGIAMLPARSGDAEKTRHLMERARRGADEALSTGTRAYDVHLRKTYFESTMKEFMYVRPDPEMVEQTGHDLIALDPYWGPSWGELAEGYAHFGRRVEAAEAFDAAVRLGAPWVRYALRSAGDLYRELGDHERALSRYYALTLFPTVESAALDVADELAAIVRPDLRDELDEVRVQCERHGVVA